jgi:hypothetical protein
MVRWGVSLKISKPNQPVLIWNSLKVFTPLQKSANKTPLDLKYESAFDTTAAQNQTVFQNWTSKIRTIII